MARQKIAGELSEDEWRDADFEFAYDHIVLRARDLTGARLWNAEGHTRIFFTGKRKDGRQDSYTMGIKTTVDRVEVHKKA